MNPIGKANIVSVLESAKKYLASFTIPDLTPDDKEAFRQRMRERKEREK
jgi:hypothetical protein